MKLALIVAMASNRVIGVDNQLPWHLPNDLQYFKQTTLGKPVLMGRKTFESIGRPLPGRTNIVITRQPDYQADGVLIVPDLEQAVAEAARICLADGVDEAMVIGGAEIYRQVLPLVQRMYLTEVEATIEGDAFFPEFSRQQWQEVRRQSHQPCERNPYPYHFVVLEPVSQADSATGQ